MSKDLKRCPLCGAYATIKAYKTMGTNHNTFTLYCTNKECPIMLKDFGSVEEAIKKWNNRPLEDALIEKFRVYRQLMLLIN